MGLPHLGQRASVETGSSFMSGDQDFDGFNDDYPRRGSQQSNSSHKTDPMAPRILTLGSISGGRGSLESEPRRGSDITRQLISHDGHRPGPGSVRGSGMSHVKPFDGTWTKINAATRAELQAEAPLFEDRRVLAELSESMLGSLNTMYQYMHQALGRERVRHSSDVSLIMRKIEKDLSATLKSVHKTFKVLTEQLTSLAKEVEVGRKQIHGIQSMYADARERAEAQAQYVTELEVVLDGQGEGLSDTFRRLNKAEIESKTELQRVKESTKNRERAFEVEIIRLKAELRKLQSKDHQVAPDGLVVPPALPEMSASWTYRGSFESEDPCDHVPRSDCQSGATSKKASPKSTIVGSVLAVCDAARMATREKNMRNRYLEHEKRMKEEARAKPRKGPLPSMSPRGGDRSWIASVVSSSAVETPHGAGAAAQVGGSPAPNAKGGTAAAMEARLVELELQEVEMQQELSEWRSRAHAAEERGERHTHLLQFASGSLVLLRRIFQELQNRWKLGDPKQLKLPDPGRPAVKRMSTMNAESSPRTPGGRPKPVDAPLSPYASEGDNLELDEGDGSSSPQSPSATPRSRASKSMKRSSSVVSRKYSSRGLQSPPSYDSEGAKSASSMVPRWVLDELLQDIELELPAHIRKQLERALKTEAKAADESSSKAPEVLDRITKLFCSAIPKLGNFTELLNALTMEVTSGTERQTSMSDIERQISPRHTERQTDPPEWLTSEECHSGSNEQPANDADKIGVTFSEQVPPQLEDDDDLLGARSPLSIPKAAARQLRGSLPFKDHSSFVVEKNRGSMVQDSDGYASRESTSVVVSEKIRNKSRKPTVDEDVCLSLDGDIGGEAATRGETTVARRRRS